MSIISETSASRYRASQRFLHRLLSIVLISALAIGLYCSYLTPGAPLRRALLDVHKSLGMMALVLVTIRLPLRLSLGEPAIGVRLTSSTTMLPAARIFCSTP